MEEKTKSVEPMYPISLDDIVDAVTYFNNLNGAFKIDFVLRPNVNLNTTKNEQ